jgi:hypothetical protein
MGMTLMQQTYHKLCENYDAETAAVAQQVHKIYTEALQGDTTSGDRLRKLAPTMRVTTAEAREDMTQYVGLVQRVISNQ